MKSLFVICFTFFIAVSSFAQDKNCLQDVGDKMCLVSTEGKYGIMNRKGDYIVPAYFDTVEVYGVGFIVKQNGKCGVIDRKGRIAIPVEFPSVRCVGDCNKEFLFEISDIGMKAMYITKEMDHLHGYTKVTPTLAVSTSEISIKDWFAYVMDVKNNGLAYNYGYEAALPDTNKVEEKMLPAYRSFINGVKSNEISDLVEVKYTLSYDASLKFSFYHDKKLTELKKESMMNFPVTGLTHKQVVRYTEWLCTIYRNEVNDEADLSFNLNFRLPNLDEWEKIAFMGLDKRFEANKVLDSTNSEGCMLFNFATEGKCKDYPEFLKFSFGKGSTHVYSYNPNENGLYCVFGNVAEMLLENGLAKGGSYFHTAKNANIVETMQYDGAEPWLGFRVVTEFRAK